MMRTAGFINTLYSNIAQEEQQRSVAALEQAIANDDEYADALAYLSSSAVRRAETYDDRPFHIGLAKIFDDREAVTAYLSERIG